MTDEELIKWFKKYTAITKKDNEIAETVGFELNIEISVEMAEQLINLIEKQQKQIEIKDKMIDLMAEKIFRDITDKKMKKAYGIDSKEDVKKMYFNILDEEF